MTEIKISDLANKDFLGYSVYKLYTQMPNFLDTMSSTMRKELFSLLENPDKKIKTAEIYSIIYNRTSYNHGDVSAFNVFETMAAPFKNNLPLIEAKGNFGTRTNTNASSPRYTSGKLTSIAKALFPKVDYDLYHEQIFEGKSIEPMFLLPILPISIINGFNGIGVGYSSNILPRDPFFIIELLERILRKENSNIPREIPVRYPFFNGTIEQGENDKQFIFTGKIEKGRSTKRYGTLIITEVPPGYDREKMMLILSKLEEDGVVVDINDNCVKNTFYFEIKVPIEIYEKEIPELINLFKLSTKTTETLTFLEFTKERKSIKQYPTLALFLRDWIVERIKFYKLRKQLILDKLDHKIKVAESRVKFIEAINNNDIIIQKKKKSQIIKQLEDKEFLLIDDSFDYLLNMALWNLSEDKIKELKANVRKYKQEYKLIKDKEPREFWLEDLAILKTEMEKYQRRL